MIRKAVWSMLPDTASKTSRSMKTRTDDFVFPKLMSYFIHCHMKKERKKEKEKLFKAFCLAYHLPNMLKYPFNLYR